MSDKEELYDGVFDVNTVKKQQKINPFERVGNIVFNILEDAILTSRLTPGGKLTIAKIASELHVSSTPVREAVEQLATKGLVTVERRDDSKYNNYFVFDLSSEETENLFGVRKAIESTSAYICAKKNWLVDMAALRAGATEFRDALQSFARDRRITGDPWYTAKLDRGFHNMLVSATGNSYLIGSYASLEKMLYYLSIRTSKFLELEAGAQLIMLGQQHISVCNAIEQGFPRLARDLMDEHIDFCANSCLKNKNLFVKGG